MKHNPSDIAASADRLAPLERQPLNIQVAARLRAEILTGHRLPGEKLPNELDLSGRYAVSRATIREAIGMLVFAGLVERRHGSGTYVTQGHPGLNLSNPPLPTARRTARIPRRA